MRKRKYEHTHQSANDASPSMLVAIVSGVCVFMNEDGEVWTDPIEDWEPIW